MKTEHSIITADSRNLESMKSSSIDLVVTSPPYPMIQMWDELFSSLSPQAKEALDKKDGRGAFEAMHIELDKVWRELARILKPGSIVCVNIGDATRTIGDRFMLYSNHSRIIHAFRGLNFDTLPVILWRKQTNAPNKFMGSGMLPGGAYVTLEHEYILLFRKGAKRSYESKAAKALRAESAYFWEERNKWFSDVWDFKGSSQKLDKSALRSRSAAYPFELAYRLVNMYSGYGDTVFDPFAGTGTTMLASIASARNSVSFEIEPEFVPHIIGLAGSFADRANELVSSRITSHLDFVRSYEEEKRKLGYVNSNHGFPVMTQQEMSMQIYKIGQISCADCNASVSYEPFVSAMGEEAPSVPSTGVAAESELVQPCIDFENPL
jgi:DNA modification methylase